MNMGKLITVYTQLMQLRQHLDDPSDKWTPKNLEDWRNAAQTALLNSEIADDLYEKFNSIPPGRLPTFCIVRDDESFSPELHYGQSEVDEFLKNGISQFKQFLDSVIWDLEKYFTVHRNEYDEAIKVKIEEILGKGPKH